MKKNRSIKALHIGINLILFLHIIMILVFIRGSYSSWRQIEIGSEDLIGATELYYGTRFGGFIKRSFEYVYEESDSLNPEKHLYTSSVGHLEQIDKTNVKIEVQNVAIAQSGVNMAIPVNRLPLILPVNHSQKKYFVYLVTVLSTLFILYSFTIFFLLKRFVKSVISKNPFTRENLKLLFSIGILVIVVPVLHYIIEYVELNWILKNYSFANYAIISDISFQFYLFGLGLLILAIAAVWRQGIGLKKENELTI